MAKRTQLAVDFNERDKSGNVLALPKYADGPVGIGEVVLMSDLDGNQVEGQVVDVTDRLIRALPIWDTWIPAPEANAEPDAVIRIGDDVVIFIEFKSGGSAPSATVHAADEAPIVDLMEALRASLSGGSSSRSEEIRAVKT